MHLLQIFSLLSWTQKKIFWRMLVTKKLTVAIDFHSIFFSILWTAMVTINILLCSAEERNSEISEWGNILSGNKWMRTEFSFLSELSLTSVNSVTFSIIFLFFFCYFKYFSKYSFFLLFFLFLLLLLDLYCISFSLSLQINDTEIPRW